MGDDFRTKSGSTAGERDRRAEAMARLRHSPIPDGELTHNLGLYLTRQTLSRILYMHELYRQVVDVPGVVMEFGVRWGQNMSLWQSFRGIHEPFNYSRTIVGFDTFAGFASVDPKDGGGVGESDYGVTENWEQHLDAQLAYNESESPIPHKKKYELVKGDATATIHDYLARHPETVVSLAYFDFDIYKPTKVCLEAILPRMPRGAIVAFDELNCPEFPGETLAAMEVLGIGRHRFRRSPLHPLGSYVVLD